MIFEHALEGLGGPEPERVAHVGDLRRTDVAGALGMGMTAVRYTGVFDDDSADLPEGHHVLSDHTQPRRPSASDSPSGLWSFGYEGGISSPDR